MKQNEELNMFAMPKESDLFQAARFFNVDIDSVQGLSEAERDALLAQQQNKGLFIHPDDLKDWKKFLAKMKKDKQAYYS